MRLNSYNITFESTPFPVSPRGEMISFVSISGLYHRSDELDLLLPPWGKVGKGVKKHKINNSVTNIVCQL